VPEINSAEGVTPSARASILVLDDDDGFRRFLVEALSEAGYSVVDSGDANKVLTILDGSIFFDLLITDIKMPRFQAHGIAVGNMAMLKRRGIKIIYVTGDPGQVTAGLHRHGADAAARQTDPIGSLFRNGRRGPQGAGAAE
jgi:CheY-like chemotaxis protein